MNHSRRLDRLQNQLNVPIVGNGGAAEIHMHFLMVNLPTFEAAVERAKACGARSVVWVPSQGETQSAEWEHAGRNMPADALAFEGPYATINQLRRIIKDADTSYVIEDDDTKVGGVNGVGGYSRNDCYSGHPPREQPPPAGHEERVEVMEGDRCTMRLNISPEELPS